MAIMEVHNATLLIDYQSSLKVHFHSSPIRRFVKALGLCEFDDFLEARDTHESSVLDTRVAFPLPDRSLACCTFHSSPFGRFVNLRITERHSHRGIARSETCTAITKNFSADMLYSAPRKVEVKLPALSTARALHHESNDASRNLVIRFVHLRHVIFQIKSDVADVLGKATPALRPRTRSRASRSASSFVS